MAVIKIDGERHEVSKEVAALFQAVSEERDELKAASSIPYKPTEFKVWDNKKQGWVLDNLNDYIELNWTLPGYKKEGQCFVDQLHGADIEIVFADKTGEFRRP